MIIKRRFSDLAFVGLFLNLLINANVIAAKSEQSNEIIQIRIENTLDLTRRSEVIELDFNTLSQKNSKLMASPFIVSNATTLEEIPYQIVTNESKKPVLLLVQLSIPAKAVINLEIRKGEPKSHKTKTYGRLVPERKDDFTWENDKIAFRMYGPALQATGEISSGIDVWVKRTSEMIIDKWYQLDNYHQDNGEGVDCYKVGSTLGAGGIAPIADGKLYCSKNWATYKIIYSGTLRTVFELSYQSWNFNGIEISETKRVAIDAGSQLNKMEVTYTTTGLDTIPIAIGIVKRKEKGVVVMNEQEGIMSYWEPANKKYGVTGIGVIVPENKGMGTTDNHLVTYSNALNKRPFIYFQGACWDKAGEMTSEPEWVNYLKEYKLKNQYPLIISY